MATDDYAVTLYTFLQLEDGLRLDRLLSERFRLDQAALSALAFHEPKKLREAEDRFLLKLRNVPSRAETLRRAAELVRRIEAMEAKKGESQTVN